MLTARYTAFMSAKTHTFLQYRGALAMTATGGVISVAVQVFLWRAVAANAAGGRVGGFDGRQLTTYILVAQLLALVHANRVDEEIAEDIYTGSIVASVIRPVSYPLMRLAVAIPVVTLNAVFVAGPVLVPFLLLVPLSVPTPARAVMFVASVLLSVVIAFLVNLLVGYAGLLTTNNWGLRNVKDGVVSFLAGRLMPISVMPGALATVCAALPFQGMVYAPTRLLLGGYHGTGEAVGILGQQAAWVLVLSLLSGLVWRRVRRRLEVFGG